MLLLSPSALSVIREGTGWYLLLSDIKRPDTKCQARFKDILDLHFIFVYNMFGSMLVQKWSSDKDHPLTKFYFLPRTGRIGVLP